jgi:hypothetical protein
MSQQSPLVHTVPTHLQEPEPFAFGRSVGEIAKLVVIGFAAARLVGSDDVPAVLRMPAAAAVLLVGASWALVRIQRRPLDGWLGLVFRYGASPRRRVWRPGGAVLRSDVAAPDVEPGRGWYELERVRVRWIQAPSDAGHVGHAHQRVATLPGRPEDSR